MVDGNTNQGGNTTSGRGGNTKREAPVTWRPSPAAAIALAQLLEQTELKRNELLNLLVIAAAHRRDHGIAEPDFDISRYGRETLREGSAATARARLQAVLPPGRVDPKKIAAFQIKTGMAFDKRRK